MERFKNATWQILKYSGFAVGAAFIYWAASEYQVVAFIAGLFFAYGVLREMIKETVREVLNEDFMSVRRQMAVTKDDIQVIDRKVSAIWNHIRGWHL